MSDKTEGSYADVAAEINERLAPHPPVSRQQVYEWHTRRTRNAAGDPWPEPVRRDDDAPRTRPRLFFDFGQALAWYRVGPSEISARQLRNRISA